MAHNRPDWVRTFATGLLTLVGMILVVVLVAAAVLIIVMPAFLVFGLGLFLREQVFRARLRLAGRALRWAAARELLRSGGTLVFEISANSNRVDRLWLLRDRLGKLDPHAPWDAFRSLETQLLTDDATLTTDDAFADWCRDRLPRLAGSAVLVPAPAGPSVLQYLAELPLRDRSVAYVIAPDMTAAVRESLARRKRA